MNKKEKDRHSCPRRQLEDMLTKAECRRISVLSSRKPKILKNPRTFDNDRVKIKSHRGVNMEKRLLFEFFGKMMSLVERSKSDCVVTRLLTRLRDKLVSTPPLGLSYSGNEDTSNILNITNDAVERMVRAQKPHALSTLLGIAIKTGSFERTLFAVRRFVEENVKDDEAVVKSFVNDIITKHHNIRDKRVCVPRSYGTSTSAILSDSAVVYDVPLHKSSTEDSKKKKRFFSGVRDLRAVFLVNDAEDAVGVTRGGTILSSSSSPSPFTITLKHWNLKASVRSVCCGKAHTMLLLEDGRLYVYVFFILLSTNYNNNNNRYGTGKYDRGQLGLGKFDRGQLGLGKNALSTITTPTLVQSLVDIHVVSVSAGSEHTMCICERGTAYVWGRNDRGQCGICPSENLENVYVPVGLESLVDEYIVQIDGGAEHTLVLNSTGQMYSFGATGPSLGRHTTLNSSFVPGLVDMFMEDRIVHISCGERHSLAITQSGNLCTWGYNQDGQLGHGDKNNRDTPCVLKTLTSNCDVVSAVCSGNVTIALLKNHNMYTWGQIHDGDNNIGLHPRLVHVFEDKNSDNVVDIPRFVCCSGKRVLLVCDRASPTLSRNEEKEEEEKVVTDDVSNKKDDLVILKSQSSTAKLLLGLARIVSSKHNYQFIISHCRRTFESLASMIDVFLESFEITTSEEERNNLYSSIIACLRILNIALGKLYKDSRQGDVFPLCSSTKRQTWWTCQDGRALLSRLHCVCEQLVLSPLGRENMSVEALNTLRHGFELFYPDRSSRQSLLRELLETPSSSDKTSKFRTTLVNMYFEKLSKDHVAYVLSTPTINYVTRMTPT